MEVAHPFPELALPHSGGGRCSPHRLAVKASSSTSPSPRRTSPASPPQYEAELSPCNTDVTKQQLEESSDGDEPPYIMTPSQCALTDSASHTKQESPDQPSADGALLRELQQQSSTISFGVGAPRLSCVHSQAQQQDTAAPAPPFRPCTLDPNAHEFTPSLPSARSSPVDMKQPSTAAVRVSLCYQASVSAMQGPCNYELVETSLRLGLPGSNLAVAAPNSYEGDASFTQRAVEEADSSFTSGESMVYTGAYEYHAYGAAAPASYVSATDASHASRTVGGLAPLMEGKPDPLGQFSPAPILSTPSPIQHMGFVPAIPRPTGPPPAPVLMPPYLHNHIPSPNMPDIQPHQALTVYTRKHFHPHYGWKEHISRALLISGIPPHLDASQLYHELEQWGHIRAFHADKLLQGIISVHFFDLRASRQALHDMQNQHLLQQQRFQQHLYAQNGLHFQSCIVPFGADDEATRRGLLSGSVVWAQYVASSSVPCPDSQNQGTLVLFNVEAGVGLQELQNVFEKYGDLREIREAPTKRQHKFIEYFDTRDAETAWAALNGQEVCGKCVKIEFSRQGPVRKQKNHAWPVPSCLDLTVGPHAHIQQIHDFPGQEPPYHAGWQGHSSSVLLPHEWHAGGHSMLFPSPNAIVMPSTILGPDGGASRAHGCFLKSERSTVNHVQGANAGPRRKQSGIVRPHNKVYHVVVHEPICGTNGAYVPSHVSSKIGAFQRNANWSKGHPHFEYDEQEVLLISGQPRTTLMVKNIPNKYSQQMLLSLLDHHCAEFNRQIVDMNEPVSAYDFVYLPIDFKNRCNLGYAFVNFTTALATLKFYKAFHTQPWEAFNSRKVCEIKYARVQGRAALENHFCNSRFACDTMEFLPVVFVPPRNGLVCPSPIVAAGLMTLKGGRPSSQATPKQALLGPPPSSKLLSDSTPHKVTAESKCLLEDAPLSGSDAETSVEGETNRHRDTNVDDTSVAQV